MKAEKRKTFKEAVEATSDIATCYKSGLTALGNHSKRIKAADTLQLQGSVNIDECTKAIYPTTNEKSTGHRWDYAIAYKSEVYFIEIHSAKTDEVKTMINKLEWLKNWLHSKAPEINKLKAKQNAFVWIQSKNFQLLPSSPQYKLAKTKGLLPVRELKLN